MRVKSKSRNHQQYWKYTIEVYSITIKNINN